MVYIIAEVGNTHEGSPGLAKQFIKTAKEVGADAIKFQTHMFEFESTKEAKNPYYFKSESRQQYFERTSFTKKEWKEIKNFAEKEIKIDFISSPFSLEAVDLLEELNVKSYKIPSGEVTNIPLLKKISKLNKPVFLSTGMSSWEEIDDAIKVFINAKCKEITILQCTSEYPCSPDRSGLNVIKQLKDRYNKLNIGFSDHTEGLYAALGAITLGASVVEKHLTLSKKMYGSDAKNSSEPDEFMLFCNEIRNLEIALKNKVDKDKMSKSLKDMKETFEKSIVLSRDLKKGETLTIEDLSFKKPGNGIKPKEYDKVIGKKLKIDMKIDEQLQISKLENYYEK